MPPRGSGAFNPAQWLELNRRQGQQMAARIANPLAAEGVGVLSDLDKAKADFATALGAGTLAFDPNASRATAQQRMAAGYTGPESLAGQEGFAALQQRAAAAQQNANLLGSSGGVEELLDRAYGHRANAFDAGLAGYANGGQFDALRQQYGELTKALGGADTESREQAKEAKEASESAAGQYKDLAASLNAPAPRPAPRRTVDNGTSPVSIPDGFGGYFSARPASGGMEDRLQRHADARAALGVKGHGKKPQRSGALGGLFDYF